MKGTKDILEELKYMTSGRDVDGAAFFQTEVLAEAIVPFLSLPPTEPAGTISESPSICLTLLSMFW